MAQVKMPTGEIVEMPDNPTQDQLNQIADIGARTQSVAMQRDQWGPVGSTARAIQSFLSDKPFANPYVNDLARGTGLAAGMLTKGATGTTGMISDAAAGLANMAGAHVPIPSQQQANLFPKPQGAAENVADFAGTMAAGGMSDPIAGAIANRYPPAPAPQPEMTQQQASTQAGRNAGLVSTPSLGNGSLTGRAAEAAVGKENLAKAGQVRNLAATNKLVRAQLGLPENAPLDNDIMKSMISKTYNEGYGPLKQAGAMSTDPAYHEALDKVLTEHGSYTNSFPGAAKNDVGALVQGFRVPGFDSGDAVNAIQNLRASAGDAYAQGNSQLGKAHSGIASALEDNIERSLNGNAGSPIGSQILDQFRNARQQLGVQYEAQRALNPATGDINSLKLAASFNKGKPLSGNLRTIGQFAAANQPVSGIPTGVPDGPAPNIIQSAIAGLLGGPHVGAAVAGLPAAKWAGAKALLTGPAQSAFVDPKTTPNFLQQLMASPAFYRSLPAGFNSLYNDAGQQGQQ